MKGYLDRLEEILRAVPTFGIIRWTWTGSRSLATFRPEERGDWDRAISSQMDLAHRMIPNAHERIVISHGGARGADELVEAIGRSRRFRTRAYRVTSAEWDRYGGWAGHQRNARMLETESPHLLSVLLHRHSRGTTGCRDNALARGIPVVQVDDESVMLPRIRGML